MDSFRGERMIGKYATRLAVLGVAAFLATACAPAEVPGGASVNVSKATPPLERYEGLNEKLDPITRVKLGRDVLVPQPLKEDILPDVIVGPYELRGETLSSALQLILDDYDVSLAFESEEGLKRRITVSNMHGKLRDVVNKVCSLADLYCHFEGGTMTIKNTETFVVDLPPIAGSSSSSSSETSSDSSSSESSDSSSSDSSGDAYEQIATGLEAVIGSRPTIDTTTHVMIYTATQRSNKYALQYFDRLRKNTALIIFETHIWEVTLDNNNRTGINWNALLNRVGSSKFNVGVTLNGAAPSGAGAAEPISISAGAGANLDTETVLEFISERGNVKTVSQPQITVLSGSSASLAVSQQQNYVSGSTRTPSTTAGVPDTTTITTATVTTGLTMNVSSGWDQATVYGSLNITLNDLLKIDSFSPDGGATTTAQLPQTTTRSLQTEIRVRPGDAILIGGLVSQKDNLSDSGPGFMTPLFTTSREARKINTELVFLLRPRVVTFVAGSDDDTPVVVDAPKEGIASATTLPDLFGGVKNLFGEEKPIAPVEVKVESGDAATLPGDISPEALAPQSIMPEDAPAEDLPASLQDQYAPASARGSPKKDSPSPATVKGGVNP